MWTQVGQWMRLCAVGAVVWSVWDILSSHCASRKSRGGGWLWCVCVCAHYALCECVCVCVCARLLCRVAVFFVAVYCCVLCSHACGMWCARAWRATQSYVVHSGHVQCQGVRACSLCSRLGRLAL